MITVVIPYYQKAPGILARALASIAAQQDCPLPVRVIGIATVMGIKIQSQQL